MPLQVVWCQEWSQVYGCIRILTLSQPGFWFLVRSWGWWSMPTLDNVTTLLATDTMGREEASLKQAQSVHRCVGAG